MKRISIFIILSAMLCMATPQATAQESPKEQIERIKAQREAQQETMQAQQGLCLAPLIPAGSACALRTAKTNK